MISCWCFRTYCCLDEKQRFDTFEPRCGIGGVQPTIISWKEGRRRKGSANTAVFIGRLNVRYHWSCKLGKKIFCSSFTSTIKKKIFPQFLENFGQLSPQSVHKLKLFSSSWVAARASNITRAVRHAFAGKWRRYQTAMIMSLHDAAETHQGPERKNGKNAWLGAAKWRIFDFFLASPKKLFETESTRIDDTGAEIYWSASA